MCISVTIMECHLGSKSFTKSPDCKQVNQRTRMRLKSVNSMKKSIVVAVLLCFFASVPEVKSCSCPSCYQTAGIYNLEENFYSLTCSNGLKATIKTMDIASLDGTASRWILTTKNSYGSSYSSLSSTGEVSCFNKYSSTYVGTDSSIVVEFNCESAGTCYIEYNIEGYCYGYIWKTGSWSTCGTDCRQQRSVGCYQQPTNFAYSDYYCSGSKPISSQSCTWGLCGTTYSWKYNSWSSCTACKRTRSVYCRRDADWATVSDSFCSGTKPSNEEICTCNYAWHQGDWGTCEYPSCQKKRIVTCKNSVTSAVVTDDFCLAISSKPIDTQACLDDPENHCSATYSWKLTDTSTCNEFCLKTRKVECIRSSDSATVSDYYCSYRPSTEATCSGGKCQTMESLWGGTYEVSSSCNTNYCCCIRGKFQVVLKNGVGEAYLTVSCRSSQVRASFSYSNSIIEKDIYFSILGNSFKATLEINADGTKSIILRNLDSPTCSGSARQFIDSETNIVWLWYTIASLLVLIMMIFCYKYKDRMKEEFEKYKQSQFELTTINEKQTGTSNEQESRDLENIEIKTSQVDKMFVGTVASLSNNNKAKENIEEIEGTTRVVSEERNNEAVHNDEENLEGKIKKENKPLSDKSSNDEKIIEEKVDKTDGRNNEETENMVESQNISSAKKTWTQSILEKYNEVEEKSGIDFSNHVPDNNGVRSASNKSIENSFVPDSKKVGNKQVKMAFLRPSCRNSVCEGKGFVKGGSNCSLCRNCGREVTGLDCFTCGEMAASDEFLFCKKCGNAINKCTVCKITYPIERVTCFLCGKALSSSK